ncbi:hypothetical protein NC652_027773 [Populus alba x Populus x berolinensis]|nr:hypothetical protein NC652_027773 [Populus alba x Populus x berolinensis]
MMMQVAEVNGEYVVISSRGVQNNIDILSLSYTRHAEDVRHCNMAGKPAVVTLVVDSMTENLRPPRAEATNVANAILDGNFQFEKLPTTVVAALASDPNVWNAVWENKALQELLQSQNANKEYVADNESVGDTDSQDAAVSSKKLTELSDDENETGNSQTGLMDVINNVKLTVVDMVTNVSAYFKKIFSFSSAEHTRDAADENTGSSTTEKTLGASLMALAVMVCKFQEVSLTMVAALASDPNVWNAVWENKALQELLQSQNANKEYVADNESVGDTDSQDAAVSSKKLTELSDDENETGNSQTGLMDVINNVKLTVVDMVTNVSAYFKKIFSFSSAEHTPDAADEKAGSSTTEKTLGASLMALAVMVAEVNGEYVVISSRGVQNNIDILSLSYTRHAEDVRHILQEADGVILSRGNLGIDLPPEKNLRPPRAEATDVANAILDGSNAILLGAETLRGLIMEREKQLSIMYQKTRSGNPFSSKATRSFSKLDLTGAISKEMINLSNILFVQFLHFVSIPWIAGNLYVNFKRLLFRVAQQFNKVFVELVQGGHGHLVMMKKKLITKMIIVTTMDVMKQIWREICYCENEGQVIELLHSLGKSEGLGYHMLEKHIVQDW